MNKYWDNQPDIEIDTGKNILRYYKNAGILQTIKKFKKGDTEGIASTVALNLDAIRETPEAVELLKMVISDIA
jgi:hypothetical protein